MFSLLSVNLLVSIKAHLYLWYITRVCVCVYLLSGHRLGQRATAVAESPTSKTEEQGLIPAGGAVSPGPSDLHGPHTITWTDRRTAQQSQWKYVGTCQTSGGSALALALFFCQ